MSDEDTLEKEMRALLRSAKINVPKGNAKDYRKAWTMMLAHKPRLISQLKSTGMPEPEKAFEKMCGLIGGVAIAYGGGAESAVADELLFRKRQSEHPKAKKKSGLDEFDELALQIWKSHRDKTANEIWGLMKKKIEEDRTVAQLHVEGEFIVLNRENRTPRTIKKTSFPVILSKLKEN